jgi:hypothetical protein
MLGCAEGRSGGRAGGNAVDDDDSSTAGDVGTLAVAQISLAPPR